MVCKKPEFMWENVKNLQNHIVGRRFFKETKRRPTRWFGKFLTFSHMISVIFQTNWLYLGLKTQLVWKKTEFMWENVKKLRNHLVDRCFHFDAKPCKTFHCALVEEKCGFSLYTFSETSGKHPELETRQFRLYDTECFYYAKVNRKKSCSSCLVNRAHSFCVRRWTLTLLLLFLLF